MSPVPGQKFKVCYEYDKGFDYPFKGCYECVNFHIRLYRMHALLQRPQCQDKGSKSAMNMTKVLIILSKDAMNVLISTFVYTGCMHCYNVPSARTKVQSML